MSTFKTTSGDLTLTGGAGTATLTINYANTIFNGSLTYTGNVTTVDDFIVVAANNSGSITDMGMLAQTGPTTFAGLRFDVPTGTWQVSPSVQSDGSAITAYANIATGNATVAGSNTQIQFNDNGSFGGNANLTFNRVTNVLTLQGSQTLGNVGTAPSSVSNSVVIYNNAPGSGRTGLYTVTPTTSADELISLTRARLYAIIF